MNFFEFLLLGHLTGDFLFQTNWMARKKADSFTVLFIHSTIYTLFIGLASILAGRFSWLALLIILLSHMLLDNRGFVNFWVKNINQSMDIAWLKVVVDQCWHLIILGVVAICF